MTNVYLRFNTHLQKGYDDLQSIVPTCQQQSEFAMAAQKISKATVLQKSKCLTHNNDKPLDPKIEQISKRRIEYELNCWGIKKEQLICKKSDTEKNIHQSFMTCIMTMLVTMETLTPSAAPNPHITSGDMEMWIISFM